MGGDAVADANVEMYQGANEIHLDLTSEGRRTFGRITTDNIGRQLAIVLDGVVYSYPTIEAAITTGSARITGGFGMEEAREIKVVLKSGALPASLEPVEERTVGPTLGLESIKKGILAILIGFLAILTFMIIFYKKSGVVAVVSLAVNLVVLVAGLSLFGATLTLPGLAGLALTIGMAVDSNVLIFERIKDELRNGATRDVAVKSGFDKAMSAIVDANVTTLLSGLILYAFGNGPIRGFAVTLCLGILTTIYCAVFCCRLAFDIFELKGKPQLSI
jgi:preprotein translocase subunit SecD